LKIKAYKRFKRCYEELPENIQKKVDKQLYLLAQNIHHPSLQTKKIKGAHGIWEGRVDLFYRITFEIIEDTIFLRAVGNHDAVLKKP
jgi:mRNA-degrading endonuclease RelE of RelBE toxin-antitoxin system